MRIHRGSNKPKLSNNVRLVYRGWVRGSMTKNRKWLVKSIDEILLPSLRRAGFFVVPLSKEDARSPEIRAAFPFGRLRRQRNAGFDQIEVQLDKRGGSAFRLNLGFFPVSQVAENDGSREPDDDWVHYLGESAELCERGFFSRWFSVKRLPWTDVSEDAYQRLVARVAGYIPEIENYFRSDSLSCQHMPHIRRIKEAR